MNESETLLLMTLEQFGCIVQEEKVTALSQIKNDTFGRIVIRICRKLIELKNLNMEFPETLSHEMNKRYSDVTKIVEFLKSLGLKSDLNINNILFPSKKDMQRIFEFTIEMITSNDSGANEYGQGVIERNITKIKLGKSLVSWVSDMWVIPELNKSKYPKETSISNIDKYYLKDNKSTLASFDKIITANSNYITPEMKLSVKNSNEILNSSKNIKIIQEKGNPLKRYSTSDQNHNYIVNKLKAKNSILQTEKTTNQTFIECMNDRNQAMDFLYKNYKENNFENNMHIINKKNRDIFLSSFLSSLRLSTVSQLGNTNDEMNKKDGGKDIQSVHEGESDAVSNANLYQSKMENIMSQFEKEKQQKNDEIKELNNRLFGISNKIDKCKEDQLESSQIKKDLMDRIQGLSLQNQSLLKEIEDQMTAFEQMKRLNKSEIKEDDIVDEVLKLEKKYDEMVQNWTEYSTQAKTQIEDHKATINTKKKEYNYKCDQITVLKEEIHAISNKIAMKQELAAFLNEEYQKMPGNVNRNHFINKIAELTKSINQERSQITIYLNDLKTTDTKISQINETYIRIDNELEDKLYQDAKNTSSLNEVYTSFIKLRDGYNDIQKNIIDTNNLKQKLKQLENKVDDYSLKLRSYDMNQLKEQVDYLKKANKS